MFSRYHQNYMRPYSISFVRDNARLSAVNQVSVGKVGQRSRLLGLMMMFIVCYDVCVL